MADRLADINLRIEDMGNMLDQTEYLINDVVYIDGHKSSLTISIGIADSKSENISNLWDLYRNADSRLYAAKNGGKNQLKAYND